MVLLAFAWISNSQLVLNSTLKQKAVCWDRYEYIIEVDSWSLIVKEIENTYDDKYIKLIYHGHTLPCLHTFYHCLVPRRIMFNLVNPFFHWTYV